MNKLEDILKNTPEIEHYSKVAGYGLMSGQGTSYGTIIIRLKDWGERKGRNTRPTLWWPVSMHSSTV